MAAFDAIVRSVFEFVLVGGLMIIWVLFNLLVIALYLAMALLVLALAYALIISTIRKIISWFPSIKIKSWFGRTKTKEWDEMNEPSEGEDVNTQEEDEKLFQEYKMIMTPCPDGPCADKEVSEEVLREHFEKNKERLKEVLDQMRK